jgi:hypothetical protein
MAGMGPLPKPAEQRRRRNAGLGSPAGLLRLPLAGRAEDPPTWPLSKPTRRETVLWARLWRTPQAVAWERLDWTDAVARYARQLTSAEKRTAPVKLLGEVRQLEDRLGLNPLSLLRLRWEIVDMPTEAEAQNVVELRARIKAVDA